jgi:hypothetical protein
MRVISHKPYLLQQHAACEWSTKERVELTNSNNGFWISDDEFLWTGTQKQLERFVKKQYQPK